MPAASPSACPHCAADQCLPLWRKLTLGPGATARCRTCGLRVGVDVLQASLALLPTMLLVLLVVAGVLDGVAVLAGGLLGCLAITFALYAVWVRLVPGEISNPRIVAEGKQSFSEKKNQKTF